MGKRLFDDCTKCQALIQRWNNLPNGKSVKKRLVCDTMEVFVLGKCKWDKKQDRLMITLVCKECGNTVTVPAVIYGDN